MCDETGESGETYDVEMAARDLSRKPRSLPGQEQSSHSDIVNSLRNNVPLSTGFLASVFVRSGRLFRSGPLVHTSPCFWHGPSQLSIRDEADTREEEEEWDEWNEWNDAE